MAATDLAIRIATIFSDAGIKKAGKSMSSLEKTTKSLGRALGVSLSVVGVTAFGKASVRAFMDAEKANTRLANSVNNLGLSFATAGIQTYLDDISRSAGIAGEVLVDAFQPLLTTTGSVAKSQEILNQALEVAAGTGVSLTTVTQDLANAYVGNTKGLKKYNLGLTQAELKAASFLQVQEELNKQYAGSQARYLDTYAGKVQVLTEAYGNLQEVVGKSLVDAFMTFTGSATTNDLVDWIDDVARRMSGLITSAEKFGFTIRGILKGKNGDEIAKEWQNILSARSMATARPFDPTNNSLTGYAKDQAAIRKAEANAKKRAKELVDAQKKNTAELKKQAALKKAGTVFDLTQIQMIAALKGQLTEEEKLRVQAMLAIENENVSVATRLTNQILMAQDATGALAKLIRDLPDAKNPFANWTVPGIPSSNAVDMSANPLAGIPQLTPGSAGFVGPTINVSVGGSVVSEQGLIDAVRGGLNVASLSGSGSTVRRIGGF